MTPAMYAGQEFPTFLLNGTTVGDSSSSSKSNLTDKEKRLITRCDPSCLPAHWHNIVARQYMARKCIPVVTVFDNLAWCFHAQHAASHDCTHYSFAAIKFLNYIFLRDLALLKNQSKEGIATS